MTPFDLINTERYTDSPFSVPCPICGSIASFEKKGVKTYPTYKSQYFVDVVGEDPDVLQGTVFGVCRCNNRECQEFLHFVGTYVTKRVGSDENELMDGAEISAYGRKFVIKYFLPAVPLIRIPPATPPSVSSLLQRSFALAFMDQSASGNLLRSAIEMLLTELKVRRFGIHGGKRTRLTLHERIGRLPLEFKDYRDGFLAIKWIGNAASHTELDVMGLRVAFKILEHLLEGLYGTEKKVLERAIKEINRRKKP